jgi:hypothetical protein
MPCGLFFRPWPACPDGSHGGGRRDGVLPAGRTGLAVTLYADGFGLVATTGPPGSPKGPTAWPSRGVSPAWCRQRALRTADGVRVTARDFCVRPVVAQALLERSVGKTVRVIRTRPDTGEDIVEAATVLAAANGPVLKIGDRIETSVPGAWSSTRCRRPSGPADAADRGGQRRRRRVACRGHLPDRGPGLAGRLRGRNRRGWPHAGPRRLGVAVERHRRRLRGGRGATPFRLHPPRGRASRRRLQGRPHGRRRAGRGASCAARRSATSISTHCPAR